MLSVPTESRLYKSIMKDSRGRGRCVIFIFIRLIGFSQITKKAFRVQLHAFITIYSQKVIKEFSRQDSLADYTADGAGSCSNQTVE